MELYILLSVCFVTTCVSALTGYGNTYEGDTIAVPADTDSVILKLIERVERLEARDNHQQNEIDVLREELHDEKQRTMMLESTVRKMKRSQKQRIQKPQVLPATKTNSPSEDVAEVPKIIPQLTRKSRNQNRIQRAVNEVTIAFFSTLSQHLQHAGVQQNIPFDHIVTNIGNAYNNHAGVFIAPVAGVYVFSTTLMSYPLHTTHYQIVKNGHAVSNIYVRGKQSEYATSSQTAILQLKQGDDVSIQNVDADESLHGGSYSTFSGFLLQQDYSNTNIVGK